MTVNISLKYLTFVEMLKKKKKVLQHSVVAQNPLTGWGFSMWSLIVSSLYVGSLRVPRNMSVNSCPFVLVLQ